LFEVEPGEVEPVEVEVEVEVEGDKWWWQCRLAVAWLLFPIS
jgi:hypothetical protein